MCMSLAFFSLSLSSSQVSFMLSVSPVIYFPIAEAFAGDFSCVRPLLLLPSRLAIRLLVKCLYQM